MNKAVIELGSNIEPEKNISQAIALLTDEQSVLAVSKFIVTKPVGYAAQPDFINGAVLIETSLNYQDLCTYCKSVEKRLGRVRSSNKNGPRTIDLDIIVWNDKVASQDFYSRDFVQRTVLEVLPDLQG